MFFINHIRKYFVNRSISKHKANMAQFRNAWNTDTTAEEDTGTISLHNKFVTEQKSYSNLNKMTTDGTLKKGFGMGSTDGLAGVTQNLSALGKKFTEDDFKMQGANDVDQAVRELDALINACRNYFKFHQTTEVDQRKRSVGQKRLDFVRFAKRKAENKKYCLYYERCVQGIKKFWPDIEGEGIRKGKPMGNSLNPTQMNQQLALLTEMQQKEKLKGDIPKIEEERIIKHDDLNDAQRAAAAAAAFVFDEYGNRDWYNAAGNLSTYLSELMTKISEHTNGKEEKDYQMPASELLTEEVKRNLKEKLQAFRNAAREDWTVANVSVTNTKHQASLSIDEYGNTMVW